MYTYTHTHLHICICNINIYMHIKRMRRKVKVNEAKYLKRVNQRYIGVHAILLTIPIGFIVLKIKSWKKSVNFISGNTQ